MTMGSRWLRFNVVGIGGFVVQVSTLWTLTRWLEVAPVIAVPLAVMVTVSHNFLWHERFTWPSGRVPERDGRWRRWVTFNLSNGLISVLTNSGVTALAVTVSAMPLVAANALAVAITSLLNFLVADRLVFRTSWAVGLRSSSPKADVADLALLTSKESANA